MGILEHEVRWSGRPDQVEEVPDFTMGFLIVLIVEVALGYQVVRLSQCFFVLTDQIMPEDLVDALFQVS